MAYIDGMVAPILPGRKQDYVRLCREMSAVFLDHGAVQTVDAYGDADIPEGKITDLWRAVAGDKAAGEGLGFSWIVWPSKQARDTAWAACMADERMKPRADNPMDGKRMIFGGFETIWDSNAG